MKIWDLIDINEFICDFDEGFINVKAHDTLPLYLYTYTRDAQYARHWTSAVMKCRGLVADAEENIVLRSFEKFFNMSEEGFFTAPDEEPVVYPKMDGSLIIAGRYSDNNIVITKGSFQSDQAIEAKKILDDLDFRMRPNYTYLFEYLSPENRIVVDYGNYKGLVLLDVIDNETGGSMIQASANSVAEAAWFDWIGETIRPVKFDLTETGIEGYVLMYPKANVRAKAKTDEYVRLHKLMSKLSTTSLWEARAVPDGLPAEMKEVAEEYLKGLQHEADFIQDQLNFDINLWIPEYADEKRIDIDRKAFAEFAKTRKYPALLFALLDKRDISDMIWKMVKPAWKPLLYTEDDE